MKTQKMYMFSVEFGIEEVDAIITNDNILLNSGKYECMYSVSSSIAVHDKGENINYIYQCMQVGDEVCYPTWMLISTSMDDIKLYINRGFEKYNS